VYAVITIAMEIEVSGVERLSLPMPGMPAREITELLEMIAMKTGGERATIYMRVVETVIKEKQ
jgi:hypothetical protein